MKTFIEYLLEQDDPCWKGYRQLGTKKKNGKEVPNCIPIKEEKDTKEEANYQDKPKNGQYCKDCTMWREPNKCTAVEGIISPNGWCSYFEEKEEEEGELDEAIVDAERRAKGKPSSDEVRIKYFNKAFNSIFGNTDSSDQKNKAASRYFKIKRVSDTAVKEDSTNDTIQVGDGFIIELKNLDIETTVLDIEEDGIILGIDEYAAIRLEEAEYQGRDVPLNKPMAGDVKKSKVFVKGPSGRVVKVNFGDKNMTIKKHIPARRKNFRARHNCDTPGPKHKARYWSCRAW